MDDHATPVTSQPGHQSSREEAIDAAAMQVMESLARQDARTPREAAVASLGVDATEEQLTEWIDRYRAGHCGEGVAPTPA